MYQLYAWNRRRKASILAYGIKICGVKSVQINIRLNTLNYLSGTLNRTCVQAKSLKIMISKRLSVGSLGNSVCHLKPMEQFSMSVERNSRLH